MKKKYYIFFTSFILIVAFSIPSLFAAEPKQTWSAKASQKDYHIGSGDVLEITTWKEPDLTRDQVRVRTDGKISFPLLDDVQAAGLTSMEIKTNIETGLKKYVEVPFVTVTVREPASQRFYILGEIRKTGEYQLYKSLTVLQAFALAGGFTEWASKNEIILLRNENGKDKIYRINYKDIAKGKDFSQNIKVRADDTIIVP